MLGTIRIGHVRSYFATQELTFALPDGTRGSGYNVLVGKNNSGKSTLLKLIRDLTINQQRVTVPQEARHDPDRPILQLDWMVVRDGQPEARPIIVDTSGTGGLFQKSGHASIEQKAFRYVPSRRPFASQFNATSQIGVAQYEQNEFVNRRNNPGYIDNELANLIASLPLSSSRDLVRMLTRIDRRFTAIDADNIAGRDVIRFRSLSGRRHPVSDTGDGLTNIIRIAYTLATSEPNTCILIDEPELSLHPELQRNLYELLIDASSTKQIIVVTHSPHFVAWKDICRCGRLIRLFLDENGTSQIRNATTDTLESIERVAHCNITNRKYYDSVCKELFFTDEAVLVEGPDDVHYITNFLDAKGKPALPLMGYGCGGAENIEAWMKLCLEIGIKCAAIYDGDKRSKFESLSDRICVDNIECACFLLNRDDIRDKYERDAIGRETTKITKTGVFQRSGEINSDAGPTFEMILESVRSFLESR